MRFGDPEIGRDIGQQPDRHEFGGVDDIGDSIDDIGRYIDSSSSCDLFALRHARNLFLALSSETPHDDADEQCCCECVVPAEADDSDGVFDATRSVDSIGRVGLHELSRYGECGIDGME